MRTGIGVLVALTLTGCAGGQLSPGSAAPGAAPVDASMNGRWILSTPNAPSCGLVFGGAPGARAGTLAVDGGCPGTFYTSKRWAIEAGVLTIVDNESQPLAQLKVAGTQFEGQSIAGVPLTLAR